MNPLRILFISSFAMLTIFSSCTKEEPVDPCTNGFLDPGEDAPDCGGNCDPCDNTPAPYLGIQVNGVPTVMTTKSLSYDGTNWTLTMANDSLAFNFCLGATGDIGSFAMPSNCTSAAFNGLNYPNKSSGSYAISSHDLQDDLMSGYFQVDFSRTGFLDTIHVTNGVFEFYEY